MSCVQNEVKIVRWTAIFGYTQKVRVIHKSFRPLFSNQQFVYLSGDGQISVKNDHEPKQYGLAEHNDV